MDLTPFQGLRLYGGFVIVHVEFVQAPLVDAWGRAALAKTQIVGREFRIALISGLTEHEISVSLYHEILEACTIASTEAPMKVREFTERDFEKAGYQAHDWFDIASPESLNRMLQFHGFPEQ
jgi:hypothetical protein